MPAQQNFRGSYPLHHLDSVHHGQDDQNHDPAETPLPSPLPSPRRSLSDRTLALDDGTTEAPAPSDVEKGLKKEKPDRSRSMSTSEPPETRAWKDNIVTFDSKTDPANPKNWTMRRKYQITMLLGLLTMTSTFASSIFSAAIPSTSMIFGKSQEVMTLGTSLFILGYVPGPIVWGPLSEVYGRRTVLVPVFIFMCLSAATATSDRVEAIMITRFFAGLMASAPVTTVGGGLADMFDQRERGGAVVLYSLAIVAAPTIAPIIGAAVSDSYLGWRWTMYLCVILTGAVLLNSILFIPETLAPVLLTRKAERLRRATGRWELHSRHEMNDFALKHFLEKNVTLPLKMLFLEPMVTCIATYNSLAYGCLYLLFGAVPIIFEQGKGWTPVQGALPFLAVLCGTLSAAAINFLYSILVFAPHLDAHNGVARPEMRLPPMMLGGILFPSGFFLLGWAPTVGQIFGLVFIGASFLLIFQAGINFLIDMYAASGTSASAVGANTALRSVFAAALPLVAMPLFNNLGVNYACTLLGCIAGVLGCVPFLFYIFGARLRAMSRLASPKQN